MKKIIIFIAILFLFKTFSFSQELVFGYDLTGEGIIFLPYGENNLKTRTNKPLEIISNELIETSNQNLSIVISNNSFDRITIDKNVFLKINNYRKTNGIEPLIWSQPLQIACKIHSDYVSTMYYYCDHTEKYIVNGKAVYLKPSDRIRSIANDNIVLEKTMENIHMSYLDNNTTHSGYIEEVVDGWKSSPEHNKALLDQNVIYGSVYTSMSLIKILVDDKIYYIKKITTVLLLIKADHETVFSRSPSYNSIFKEK